MQFLDWVLGRWWRFVALLGASCRKRLKAVVRLLTGSVVVRSRSQIAFARSGMLVKK
jgi:hypothetical protein